MNRLVQWCCLWLVSCSAVHVQLDPQLDPLGFNLPPTAESLQKGVTYLKLTPSVTQKKEWGLRWQGPLGERVERKALAGFLSAEDRWLVSQLFFVRLRAYYLWISPSADRAQLQKTLCEPLSLAELRWLTGRASDELSPKRLNLLLTSYLEQTLNRGASAVYPTSLGQAFGAPSTKEKAWPLSGFILADKTTQGDTQGLWLCRQ